MFLYFLFTKSELRKGLVSIAVVCKRCASVFAGISFCHCFGGGCRQEAFRFCDQSGFVLLNRPVVLEALLVSASALGGTFFDFAGLVVGNDCLLFAIPVFHVVVILCAAPLLRFDRTKIQALSEKSILFRGFFFKKKKKNNAACITNTNTGTCKHGFPSLVRHLGRQH